MRRDLRKTRAMRRDLRQTKDHGRAEGTFNLDRFHDEAPYDNREGVKLAQAHIRKTFIVPDGGQSYTLDYEL